MQAGGLSKFSFPHPESRTQNLLDANFAAFVQVQLVKKAYDLRQHLLGSDAVHLPLLQRMVKQSACVVACEGGRPSG